MRNELIEKADILKEKQGKGFGLLSAKHLEELEDFNESASVSMKLKRGFF